MIRGRRTIRLAKWVGVGLCVLIAVAWAVSLWWLFGINARPALMAGIENGVFIAEWKYRPANRMERIFTPARTAVTRRSWPLFAIRETYSVAIMPLWLPLALLALPVTWLFRLDRRKPRPGFCGTCGYDLTGNVSGVCPECGVSIR